MSRRVDFLGDLIHTKQVNQTDATMIVQQIASNQTELMLADGTEILISYVTPVAARVPGLGWVQTSQKWSATTTKHINKWLIKNRGGCKRSHCRSVGLGCTNRVLVITGETILPP